MGNYKLKEASVIIVLLLLALSSIVNGMENMNNNRDGSVLYEGWNLIGWNYPFNTTASSLAENISNCTSVSKWDPIIQTYDTYIVDGPPTFDFEIEPAMGLFIDLDENSNWYPFGYYDGHSLDAADGDPVDVVYVNNDGNVGIGTTSPSEKLEVNGSIEVNGTVSASNFVGDGSGLTNIPQTAMVPIGSIISWCKDLTGVPSLSDNFLECNGQIVNDPESPLDGVTLPDLNGENRFLRGSTNSGGTGGSETHRHSLYNGNQNFDRGHDPGTLTMQNHLPPYYNIIWIMRIK